MARIDLLDADDLDSDDADLLSSFRTADQLTDDRVRHLLSTDERNVYRSLARVPDALRHFRAMGGTLWEEAGLDQRTRELVVLAVARATDSHYEWHQHVRIGLDAGLTETELLAIAEWDLDPFPARERALLDYAAAWTDRDVTRATHDALTAELDDTALVAVNLLCGMYVTIANAMHALDVEVEEPFVGWQLERL